MDDPSWWMRAAPSIPDLAGAPHAALGNHLGPLGPLVVAEPALEEAGHVLQHVDVAGAGGADRQRLHEARAVGRQRLAREAAGDETPQRGVVTRAVGQNRELVSGVEGVQVTSPRTRLAERRPAGGGEHARDEALPEAGVGQPAFLLDRQQGQRVGDGGGEHPAAHRAGPAVVAVHAPAEGGRTRARRA
jgi:hypothetical protein